MSKLFHFLTDLALDSKKQSSFINNPSFLVKEVGLSEVEQMAMSSKDTTKITALFTGEQVSTALTLSDPGPDPLPDPDPSPMPDPDSDRDESRSDFN